MATPPPVIISDDGSPPPLSQIKHLRVARAVEFMQELKSNDGRHTLENSMTIEDVTIILNGDRKPPQNVRHTVEVLGDLNTVITVKMDSDKVVVITSSSLNEDFVPGFGRYAAADEKIKEVIVDNIDKTFTAKYERVRVEIGVS